MTPEKGLRPTKTEALTWYWSPTRHGRSAVPSGPVSANSAKSPSRNALMWASPAAIGPYNFYRDSAEFEGWRQSEHNARAPLADSEFERYRFGNQWGIRIVNQRIPHLGRR